MIPLGELKGLPEAKRLKAAALVTLLIWAAAAAVFSFAHSLLKENERLLSDSGRVLSAAVKIRSYPQLEAAVEKEPLSVLSEVVDKLGLQDRVAQLASSPSGLVLQLNRLYRDEFVKLAEDIGKNGLSVNTAEIRAFSSNKDGRLINVTLTVTGAKE
ncbi:MAG: hypothetical protein IJM42_04000 [Synergistes sp.]|nr:hypothetical protein [Synergistes sp.]MCR5335940.1 hypothetical protein [Synergistes sp.]